MTIDELEDTRKWAERQWSQAQLGDQRRSQRAVQLGAALAADPAASLPKQAASWAGLKAAYRLLNETDVTHQSLLQPHALATQLAAKQQQQGVVLFIQDTSDLNFSHHQQTKGLGFIGDGQAKGLIMHSCLALLPDEQHPHILGVAGQKVWIRETLKHRTETRSERNKRWKESEVWAEIVEQMGAAPNPSDGTLWVSVADRASDNFSYWWRARQCGWHILSRVVQERVIESASGEKGKLLSWARQLPTGTQKQVVLRGRDGTPKREVELQISYSKVKVLAPQMGGQKHQAPIEVWCVRGWEVSQEAEAIEWVLLTTLEVSDEERAKQVIAWYAHRWVIEEYHKCLKSGCRLEARQLRSGSGLMRLLGFLAIVAVRLLQLRAISRQEPSVKANVVVAQELIEVVVAKAQLKRGREELTLREFWHGVARLGGFIGRKSDGEPGWQTLWQGWQRVQDMYWGATLRDSS